MAQPHGEPDVSSLVRNISLRTTEEVSSAFLELISENIRCRKLPGRQTLVAYLLKLGLIDELIQLFLHTTQSDTKNILTAIDYLTKVIDNKFIDGLDAINPRLQLKTLKLLLTSLQDELDKDLTMNLVCMVLLATNLFLLKLDTTDENLLESSMSDLKLTFIYLARYLRELPLRASDILVRATNDLVISVKNRLDTLSDNITIRESFKTIVESVAEQCLIESHYKGAAMLYSQIEDNVNAIKSLMRAGEVDIVVDYALLVRDISVNRITINYLKHLKVDARKIEEFILKTKN